MRRTPRCGRGCWPSCSDLPAQPASPPNLARAAWMAQCRPSEQRKAPPLHSEASASHRPRVTCRLYTVSVCVARGSVGRSGKAIARLRVPQPGQITRFWGWHTRALPATLVPSPHRYITEAKPRHFLYSGPAGTVAVPYGLSLAAMTDGRDLRIWHLAPPRGGLARLLCAVQRAACAGLSGPGSSTSYMGRWAAPTGPASAACGGAPGGERLKVNAGIRRDVTRIDRCAAARYAPGE